jgi:hypothetical protein
MGGGGGSGDWASAVAGGRSRATIPASSIIFKAILGVSIPCKANWHRKVI